MGLRPRPVSVAAFGRAHVPRPFAAGDVRCSVCLRRGADRYAGRLHRACRPVGRPQDRGNRFHGGRSPPPSLIPGAHQVPVRTMGRIMREAGRVWRSFHELSCEKPGLYLSLAKEKVISMTYPRAKRWRGLKIASRAICLSTFPAQNPVSRAAPFACCEVYALCDGSSWESGA